MAFVIAEPCIGVKDTACVDACPVDCIHPKKDTVYEDGRPGFNDVEQLYMDPVERRPITHSATRPSGYPGVI